MSEETPPTETPDVAAQVAAVLDQRDAEAARKAEEAAAAAREAAGRKVHEDLDRILPAEWETQSWQRRAILSIAMRDGIDVNEISKAVDLFYEESGMDRGQKEEETERINEKLDSQPKPTPEATGEMPPIEPNGEQGFTPDPEDRVGSTRAAIAAWRESRSAATPGEAS